MLFGNKFENKKNSQLQDAVGYFSTVLIIR